MNILNTYIFIKTSIMIILASLFKKFFSSLTGALPMTTAWCVTCTPDPGFLSCTTESSLCALNHLFSRIFTLYVFSGLSLSVFKHDSNISHIKNQTSASPLAQTPFQQLPCFFLFQNSQIIFLSTFLCFSISTPT